MILGQRFFIEVEGLGKFEFRDKTYRDQLSIEALASEILGRKVSSLRPDESELAVIALAFASLCVLTSSAPAGWDLQALDPLDNDDSDKLLRVYGRLDEELTRFRDERKQRRISAGAGA